VSQPVGEPASFSTPPWVKDAVFYQIFPDRFVRSNQATRFDNLEPWDSPPTRFGFKGGDLLGVAEHLDYLQDLGITAIYLNPIFQSASNHRYHTHDYYRIDPILGGGAAFRTLLDRAHRRDIRILLDGVFNHASRGFFQFHHILETGQASPYLNWFIVNKFPLNAYGERPGRHQYASWADLPALPKFNFDNPQVRRFILDVARYWIERGIDGWRLDVPAEIEDQTFWQEFRHVVKSANPQAYLVGEIVTEAQAWLQGDRFDGVMNYPFAQACLGFFAGERLDRHLETGYMGLPGAQRLEAPAFARRVEELLNLYPREAVLAQLNLLDSHDTPRFLSLSGGGESGLAALRLATLFQMTYPGAPCVYYGDEIGMQGGRDPDCRRAFPWGPSPDSPHPNWDLELLEFFKRCIALRKEYSALRGGDFISLLAWSGVYAYLRRDTDATLLVVLNNQADTYKIDIEVRDLLPEGVYLQAVLGKGEPSVHQGRLTGAKIHPYSGSVYLMVKS
jgi:cyclomaltodextrinase